MGKGGRTKGKKTTVVCLLQNWVATSAASGPSGKYLHLSRCEQERLQVVGRARVALGAMGYNRHACVELGSARPAYLRVVGGHALLRISRQHALVQLHASRVDRRSVFDFSIRTSLYSL